MAETPVAEIDETTTVAEDMDLETAPAQNGGASSKQVREEEEESGSDAAAKKTKVEDKSAEEERLEKLGEGDRVSLGLKSFGSAVEMFDYFYKLLYYWPTDLNINRVTDALRKEGLESSNLILGIDFTKSNEWTGKKLFNNRSMHAIGNEPNPYEKAISIIGKILSPFDEDNLIPCFGFGDATTHDQEVFSFHTDHSPYHGFEEVLTCYKRIVPNLKLSGPNSYGPVIEAAMDIVEKSAGQYHVLVIVADGHVKSRVLYGMLMPVKEVYNN